VRFEITEQITTPGSGDLSVLVKEGRVFAESDESGKPKFLFQRHELESFGFGQIHRSVCVGRIAGKNIGLVCLNSNTSHSIDDDNLCGLRQLLPELSFDETQAVSRAAQLDTWLSLHRYCGRCGHEAALAEDDRALVCPNCGNRMYPKLAPCVIGIVIRDNKILLAHGVRHRKDIYTALAGFVEVGESAEQAFAREVKEEVGIEVKNIEYVGSQNWPFPHQLMLAFVCDYAGGELNLDEREILDAGWYDRSDLPSLPGHYTIARSVIEEALKRI
jgi:NAD+ diphosphatase